MLNQQLIVIPTKETKIEACDFVHQTSKCLTINNLVIIYWANCSKSIREIITSTKRRALFIQKEHRLYYFYPLDLIPFKRFIPINQANQLINWIIFTLIIKLISRPQPIIWFFFPEHIHFFRWLKVKLTTIYDSVDYHQSSDSNHTNQIRYQEKQLIQSVDHFFVNSHTLAQLHSKTRKPDKIVPQGFRINDFQNPLPTKINFKTIYPQKAVIGFVGGLNYRLDYKLLIPLAKNNPQWHFVFWGPVQKDPQDLQFNTQQNLQKLISFSNVSHGRSKNRNEIPSIIKQFDICTIPYDTAQDFNKYCYPMKLFEYFYLGKPVISAPIQELARFPKLVTICRTPKQWQVKITKLLQKTNTKKKHQQTKLANSNSWENKIRSILKHINQ